jgi:ADYC domain
MKTPSRKLGFSGLLLLPLLLHGTPARAMDCDLHQCGGNTPVLFATPIIGLSTNGAPGETFTAKVELLPTLTRVRPLPSYLPDCPLGAQLIVQGGELKGTLNGQVVCEGASLIGMAFEIIAPVSQGVKCSHSSKCRVDIDRKRAKIRVDAIGAVSDWVLPVSSTVNTYRLVWEWIQDIEILESTPLPVLGESICPRREAWMEPWQTASRLPTADVRRGWRAVTDHVMLVEGEIYNHGAAIHREGAEWFSLACAATAISKMRLLGYKPTSGSTKEERQATLRMLSGRYHDGKSFTAPGIPLMWRHRDPKKQFVGQPTPNRWSQNLVEAYWTNHGASCISHRRTWRTTEPGVDVAVPLANLLPESNPVTPTLPLLPCVNVPLSPSCKMILSLAEERSLAALRAQPTNMPTCAAPPKSYHYWVTYPVDHLPHPLSPPPASIPGRPVLSR